MLVNSWISGCEFCCCNFSQFIYISRWASCHQTRNSSRTAVHTVAQRDAQDTLFTGLLKNPKWIFIITHYTGGTFPQPLLWDHLSHGSQTDGILKFSELPFNQIISSKLNLTKYIFAKFYRRPGRDHHLTTFQNLV